MKHIKEFKSFIKRVDEKGFVWDPKIHGADGIIKQKEIDPDEHIAPIFIPTGIYDNESKYMICAYKILSKDNRYIKVENIQEIPVRKGFYFDDTPGGNRLTKVVDLPIKQVIIGKDLPDGYTEISIPYWLYKKNINDLRIMKLDKSKYRLRNIT